MPEQATFCVWRWKMVKSTTATAACMCTKAHRHRRSPNICTISICMCYTIVNSWFAYFVFLQFSIEFSITSVQHEPTTTTKINAIFAHHRDMKATAVSGGDVKVSVSAISLCFQWFIACTLYNISRYIIEAAYSGIINLDFLRQPGIENHAKDNVKEKNAHFCCTAPKKPERKLNKNRSARHADMSIEQKAKSKMPSTKHIRGVIVLSVRETWIEYGGTFPCTHQSL